MVAPSESQIVMMKTFNQIQKHHGMLDLVVQKHQGILFEIRNDVTSPESGQLQSFFGQAAVLGES